MSIERENKNATQKFQFRIRVTSQCRFNAAKRLVYFSKVNFFTTTIFSLGLILIPLLQGSKIKLYLSNDVLSSAQIFLAVTVLVYSVAIATAKYDLRSDLLQRCADKLKDLNRKVETACKNEENPNSIELDDQRLKKYNKRYTEIVAESENHETIDYWKTIVAMTGDFKHVPKSNIAFLYIRIGISYICKLLIPILLITIEAITITDMLNITNVFSFLRG